VGEDWSDNEETTHEIVVEDSELTELDENVRSEQVIRKTGPAWVTADTSEAATIEPSKTGKFKAPKISDKKPPAVNAFNFPTLDGPVETKTTVKTEVNNVENKQDKTQTNNRYQELVVADEEEVKTEAKQVKTAKKKGKKSKKEWKVIETKVTIASTVEEINSNNMFQKEVDKIVDKYDRPQESRSFNIKPSGTGFRNFDNKLESAPFHREEPPKSQVFSRRTDFIDRPVEQDKNTPWRRTDNSEQAKTETNAESKTSDSGPKRFFNKNKGAVKESIDPFQTKPKEAPEGKTDVWNEAIQVKPARKNAWRTDN
jgi:hypothetical protein